MSDTLSFGQRRNSYCKLINWVLDQNLGTTNPFDMGFTYDPIDRLTGATYKDGAAVLAQYGYTYDKADNRTTERRDQIVSTGTFNNVNELTALSGGGVVGFTGTTTEEAAVTVGGQAAQTSLVGTRFEKAVALPAGTNTVTVAAVDPSGNTNSKNYRVVVNAGASQTFTYDANGNMTSDGTRTYAWDAENRLIRIVEGPKRTEIEYDGFHHWTRIVERNGATTVSDRRFIWDGNTLVEQRNGTSTTAAQRYLPQGVQQGTNKFFYTRDHLGSIREVVNNTGSVVARYDYDPYGRRTKLSGTFDSDFGFTGHYFHAPSGLHFAPFRAYSAELGRWLSRDPIREEGGINLYSYVSNNPINLWDPWGLFELTGNEIVDAGLESFSRAGQGVVNAFTGGLFNPEDGLFYDAFNKQWEDLGEESNDCNDDFATGSAGGGFAVTTLASGAAPLAASRFSSVLANSSSIGRGSALFGRGGQFGQKGIFNQGNFRTGWGWKGSRTSGRDVFRSSWSKPGNR